MDHFLNQINKTNTRLPLQRGMRFRRITDQEIDLGRAIDCLIDFYVILIVQARLGERQFAELPYTVGLACRNDVVISACETVTSEIGSALAVCQSGLELRTTTATGPSRSCGWSKVNGGTYTEPRFWSLIRSNFRLE